MMECIVHPAVSAKEWNEFVVRNGGGFLQSFEWGMFQERYGIHMMRVMVKDGGIPVLCATVIRRPLPMKKEFWYVPFGPVFAVHGPSRREVFHFFTTALRERAPADVVFLKIEPDAEWTDVSFAGEGFVQGKDIQVRNTVIVDCAQAEDDLLKHMKQKTRYNIKLAVRHGVKIAGTNDQVSLDRDIFFSLMEETAKRQGFRLHPRKYYETMLDLFLSAENDRGAFSQKLFFAQYDGKVIACALVGFFGGRATYLHGASSDEYKNIMAPYLLHWEIIRYAKSIGCDAYDLWGVSAPDAKGKDAAWGGFSRFKFGFGGALVNYPGAHDLSFNALWYNAYRVGKAVLR